MKKTLTISLLNKAVLIIATSLLLVAFQSCRQRRFDERITLDPGDKIPYGSYVAYQNMQEFFPDAYVETNADAPTDWSSLDREDTNQLLMVLSPQFIPEEDELQDLVKFAEIGNEVFISTRYLSPLAQRFFHCNISFYEDEFSPIPLFDSLEVNLVPPLYTPGIEYDYPGKRYQMYFSSFDSSRTYVLGEGANEHVNFVCLKAGAGTIYLHLAPLAFSNYFLLHKANMSYYEKVFSLLNPQTEYVVWDRYYLHKTSQTGNNKKNDEPNLFAVLFSYPSFRWGLLTLIGLVIVFVLLEMRRKQWVIPNMAKPRNESLDFVKTIGRLYFQKGDHSNLARKMSAYFLEHIRSRYKLSTSNLDEQFLNTLQQKSGYPEDKLGRILEYIRQVESGARIREDELGRFHQLLESFYKHG